MATGESADGARTMIRVGKPVKIRLLGFAVVVACGGVLLTWVARTAWTQLDSLQKEHAAVSSESFYLGFTLRGTIRELDAKLIENGSVITPAAKSKFLQEAADLKQWLSTNRNHLAELAKLPLLKQVLTDDFEILDNIQLKYDEYITNVTRLLEPNADQLNRLSFEERYNLVRVASAKLIQLCDDLAKAQREDFKDFLRQTQGNLASHERLLRLTLLLIVSLAGTLAILVYRGLIAPLRIGLNESKSIIERQEKLASLGILASGVAHEIRNPLTAIKFRLFSAKKAVPALAANKDLSIVANEINRLERIVKDFLQFARPSPPALTHIPTGNLFEEVAELLSSELERVSIQLRLATVPGIWVDADVQQLKQVLINLIRNSVEAIGRNGSITLSTRRGMVELEGRTRSVAILAVADTGKGMPPEIQSRLFDPFFTTKETGTGLGLAIAARIVQKHGGILRYETTVNRGTIFEVVLAEATAGDVEIGQGQRKSFLPC
jgi:signal transduction histidine kinase